MSAVQEYLEKLASEHVDIGHDTNSKFKRRFFGPSKDEMAQSNRTPPIILYLHPETGEIEENNVQWINQPNLGFSVLIYNKNIQDESQRKVLDKAFQIGLDILARMRNDRRAAGADCENVLKYLDLSRVRYFDDGPHDDGYIGKAFVIPMRYAFENEYDATKWQ